MRFTRQCRRKNKATILFLTMATLSTAFIFYIAKDHGIFKPIPGPLLFNCEEKLDIIFLKVHKTGSSTIANILQRFGLSRNLNFALPNKLPGQIRYNYFGEIGKTLNKDEIISSKKSTGRYNILYNHAIFNKTSFEAVFGIGTMYRYVTMVRNPISQFLSAILFFENDRIFNISTDNITAYLENPKDYEPEEPYISFTDNRQALDLGVPYSQVRDEGLIKEYVRMLDEQFELVMVMEYFDESLVLLKRQMCWTLKDIIYLRKNTRYRTFEFNLTTYDKTLHRQWALADHLIYEHFYKKFQEHIEREPDVMTETHHFKTVLLKIRTFCKGSSRESFINIRKSTWNHAFKVTSLDCAYMTLNELMFLNKTFHDRKSLH